MNSTLVAVRWSAPLPNQFIPRKKNQPRPLGGRTDMFHSPSESTIKHNKTLVT